MKQIIRNATFETNSSSTHSMVVCTDEDYQNIENMYYNGSELLTKEEYFDLIRSCEDDFKELSDSDIELFLKLNAYDEIEEKYQFEDWTFYRKYNDFLANDESEGMSEYDEVTVKAKSGEVFHVIARYGYDG